MNYETVVTDLFIKLPKLEEAYRSKLDYMLNEPPLPYIVFGDILIPELEKALAENDLGVVQRICAFLEDAAVSARQDIALSTLLGIEVGEWLGFCANEDVLAPWLGVETKRTCNYVSGLATQRRELKAEKERQSISRRLALGIRACQGK